MPDDTAPETHWFFDQDMKDGLLIPVPNGIMGVYSARSPERDHENQDSAAAIVWSNGPTVVGVADGFGGQAGGAQASKLALQKLGASVKAHKKNEVSARDSIITGFEKANDAVRNLSIGAATTLAVVEFDQKKMRPYHAGDTEILLVGQQGKIKYRTVSHSPIGYAVEAGLINERDALHHEKRHLVSNMIGATQMRVDVGPSIDLDPKDTVLLGSDGLFDNLHIDEIVERIRKGTFEELMKAVADTCQQRMLKPKAHHPSKPDDITLIALRISG